jgi:hypothetical protein
MKARKGAEQFSTALTWFNNKFFVALLAVRKHFRVSVLLSAAYRAKASFLKANRKRFFAVFANFFHNINIHRLHINSQAMYLTKEVNYGIR